MEVEVIVTIKPGIHDPEGKAICNALSNIGLDKIGSVTTGRYFLLRFQDGLSEEEVKQLATEACEKLLANPNIQTYRFTLVKDKK